MVTSVRDYVTSVQDGDTFLTRSGLYVRLANVCAPELNEWGGESARKRLASLIYHQNVRIDQVGTSYGRIVANVYVGNRNVNQTMRNYGYEC